MFTENTYLLIVLQLGKKHKDYNRFISSSYFMK